MAEPLPPNPDGAPSSSRRDVGEESDGPSNALLLAFFAAIVGIGLWLVYALVDARNADECLTQGRRDCAPVHVPSQ